MANCLSEIWRDIPKFEGIYQASSLGRIRRVGGLTSDGRTWHGRVLNQRARRGVRASGKVDMRVNLCARGVHYKGVLVARLVCSAFHGTPAANLTVDHIDNDPTNNHADNLEWVTRSENCRRAWASGCYASRRKGRCTS